MREKKEQSVQDKFYAGVIEPSRSEWEITVVLIPKHDGKMRFCVEYQRLELATVVDTNPLPRMKD